MMTREPMVSRCHTTPPMEQLEAYDGISTRGRSIADDFPAIRNCGLTLMRLEQAVSPCLLGIYIPTTPRLKLH